MKHIKTFENFSTDNNSYTILYRGDSSKVDNYTHDKFNVKSLLGKGDLNDVTRIK